MVTIKHNNAIMKTEQIMERDLNGVIVRQSTKTSFFNANDLMALYEKSGGSEKRISSFLEMKQTREYMGAIIQDYQNNVKSGELEFSPIYSKRGKYGGTWMHPYLFIDFAMWLSPEFKLTCVKWIYDKLIEVRIDSGDTFKDVNRALLDKAVRVRWDMYSNEARMINKLAFGRSDGGQRNHATEEQLAMVTNLQNADIALIEQGLDYYERYDALKKVRETLMLCERKTKV